MIWISIFKEKIQLKSIVFIEFMAFEMLGPIKGKRGGHERVNISAND